MGIDNSLKNGFKSEGQDFGNYFKTAVYQTNRSEFLDLLCFGFFIRERISYKYLIKYLYIWDVS